MELRFYYNEENPSYGSYKKLIEKMRKMSNDFYSIDNIFNIEYNYNLMKKYERKKMKIIDKMFKEIFSYFPNLKNNSCSIYLNGSYAKGNITSGSDIDLTFYFNKNDILKYQSTIYLIRYAISVMLDVDIAHVHSFTKNFITEYRKENNLVINDSELKTKIIWTKTDEVLNISNPKGGMIAEREICEISSIKDFEALKNLYENQLKKLHPKEWIYTHKCIYSKDIISIDDLIKKIDLIYSKEDMNKALSNIKKEIQELIELTEKYYNELKVLNKIKLSDYKMLGKRKVTMLVHAFATYLRWYYISNDLDILITLNLDSLFSYQTSLIDKEIIDNIDKSYCHFRYIISKIEIWAKKYNHSYTHRSKEVIDKDIMNLEYKSIWNNSYPFCEQIKAYDTIIKNIKSALDILK